MPIKVMWRIYYSDGSTFSDLDGLPQDAPADGIQAIVQWDKWCGRTVICGNDNYIFDNSQWVGTNGDGDRSYFRAKGLLHQGTIVAKDVYDKIILEALTDPDFPKKVAWREGEPKVSYGPT